MAATIARAIAVGINQKTETSRLGTVSAEAQANTHETFTTCKVTADGSGSITLERNCAGDRRTLVVIEITAETGVPRVTLQFDKSLTSKGCELRNGRSVQVWTTVRVDRSDDTGDLFHGSM